MVRVNLINPRNLSDQHLIAEYNEILMLLGYVRKYPSVCNIPERYCLGKGHIRFFKNKLLYLKERHGLIKKEMRKRGFKAEKEVDLSGFRKPLKCNWKPKVRDILIIKMRLKEKIKKKPDYYRYYGRYMAPSFFIRLIESA